MSALQDHNWVERVGSALPRPHHDRFGGLTSPERIAEEERSETPRRYLLDTPSHNLPTPTGRSRAAMALFFAQTASSLQAGAGLLTGSTPFILAIFVAGTLALVKFGLLTDTSGSGGSVVSNPPRLAILALAAQRFTRPLLYR